MGKDKQKRPPWLRTVEQSLRTTQDYLAQNSEAALMEYGPDTFPDLAPESGVVENLPRYIYVKNPKGESILDFEELALQQPWRRTRTPNVLNEEMIGGVTGQNAELVFPNISSCLGVLCVLRDRITGMHLTVSSPEKYVKKLLEKLVFELNDGQRVRNMYCFGPIVDWENQQGKNKDMLSDRGGFGAIAYLKSQVGFTDRALLAWQQATTMAYYVARRRQDRTSPGIELARGPSLDGPFTTLDIGSQIHDGTKMRPVFELI